MTVGWRIIDPDYLIRRYIKGAEGFNEPHPTKGYQRHFTPPMRPLER